MSKDHNVKKDEKKQPTMTLKERRAAKKAKHDAHNSTAPTA